MYVFPLFFLVVPVVRTTPIVATVLLVIGAILWLAQTYAISKFITIPRKQAKQHKRVQGSGKTVQAEVLDWDYDGMIEDEPSKKNIGELYKFSGESSQDLCASCGY